MEKYFEINKNGQNIRCKLYFSKGTDIKKIVLYSHGFAGHKDNAAAQKFAERVLNKYKGIAILIFNLPCHGDDVKKKMVLSDCITYMELVLDYINTEMGVNEIYSYATSFGGYLVLKYISEHKNPFTKIALRCPAVNMADVLTKTIMKNDELDLIAKGKPVKVGFDRKIDVNSQFLDDLKTNDIQKIDFISFADDMLILHGTKDEVVPFEVSKSFAENNVIEFITVENADHRFKNPASMELAIKSVIEFFEF